MVHHLPERLASRSFFDAAYRVLKKHAHLYVFCDSETMFVAKPLGEAAGFKFWKPLIWDKRTIGMGYHYRARYETILFFEKGKRAPEQPGHTRRHPGAPATQRLPDRKARRDR